MTKPRSLCLLFVLLLASCASIPDDCSSLAATADGWRPIPAPGNASELVTLIPAGHPGPIRWYGRGNDEYRATYCDPCDGAAYSLQRIDGTWVAEADALSYCHPRASAP